MANSKLVACSSGSFLVTMQQPSIPVEPANRVRFPLEKVSKPLIGMQLNPTGFAKCAVVGSNGHGESHSDDEFDYEEPFLLALLKEIVWGLRSLVVFLLEQPSQLKHIEWPGFQNTLKTATLTLILVALLIVALSSIDSTLSYLLAWMLRKSA